MFKKFRRLILVLIITSLALTGCNPFSNSSVSDPKVDRVLRLGKFVEDVELQVFPIFNCQSQVQNTLNVSRSRTLERSVQLELEPERAAALVVPYVGLLISSIGAEYGWTKGTSITDSGGLLLNAGPESYPIYTIAWRQRWEEGEVEITNNGETEKISYKFLSEAHPEIQDVSYVECTSTGFATATALAKPDQSNSLNTPAVPTVVPTPAFVQKIIVASKTNAGVTFTTPQSGLYIFQYADGVFSFCSTCLWGTNVIGFPGGKVLWKDNAHTEMNYDAVLFGIGEIKSTKQQAIDAARGSKAAIRLRRGDQVTLVVGDSYHPDNVGEIEVDIYYVP
jgi:hypothetical protein